MFCIMIVTGNLGIFLNKWTSPTNYGLDDTEGMVLYCEGIKALRGIHAPLRG